MYNNNDVEGGFDSSSEVRSPMVTPGTPPRTNAKIQKQESKVLMMSTNDRTKLNTATETSSGRMTIAVKKVTWEKSCKRFGSLCMAVFLFAGGISLFVSGAVLYSVNSDSYGTGMMIVGAIMIIPGIYGMHKLVRWAMKHRALRQRYKGNRLSQDMIEEAEEELD